MFIYARKLIMIITYLHRTHIMIYTKQNTEETISL